MPSTETAPVANYGLQAMYNTVTSPSVTPLISMALALCAEAILAGNGGDIPSAESLLSLILRDPTLPQRVAFRIVNSLPSLTPTDAQVIAAVSALIPATGAFSL